MGVCIVSRVVATDPKGQWIFIVDQLNTHKSEDLVKYIASQIGCEADLGKKGRSGILKSMPSRQEFLENTSHRIRIAYTPKHACWLNKIELCFCFLASRLLKRASFKKKYEMKTKVLEFIEYFNKVFSKPFKWTYSGKPLTR